MHFKYTFLLHYKGPWSHAGDGVPLRFKRVPSLDCRRKDRAIDGEGVKTMKLRMSDRSPLKMPFIAGGCVVGVVLSAWYLLRTLARPVPDPVWTRFVNVSLILFVAIYLANLLRRFVEAGRGPGGSEKGQ